MRQIVFRSLAFLLGSGVLYIAIFDDVLNGEAKYLRIFMGCLLLLYGLSGVRLLSRSRTSGGS